MTNETHDRSSQQAPEQVETTENKPLTSENSGSDASSDKVSEAVAQPAAASVEDRKGSDGPQADSGCEEPKDASEAKSEKADDDAKEDGKESPFPQNPFFPGGKNGMPLDPRQINVKVPFALVDPKLKQIRSLIVAANIMGPISLFFGGVVMSFAGLVCAVLARRKIVKMQEEKNEHAKAALSLLRNVKTATIICGIALALNVISFFYLYPKVMNMVQNGQNPFEQIGQIVGGGSGAQAPSGTPGVTGTPGAPAAPDGTKLFG